MTDGKATLGRKTVLLILLGSIAAIFAVSFLYRMQNPNLQVHVKQQSRTRAPEGMTQNMAGMAQVKELMARVEKNPEDVEALTELGNMFLMMRAWDRALEPLEKAVQLQPKNVNLLKGVGICYYNKKQYDKAMQVYGEILEITPDDALVFYNMGVISKYALSKPDQAKSFFRQAAEFAGQNEELRLHAEEELKTLESK
ncbi:tetratricopeptide repeat protein [Pseudodesulfovibrio tunisiensis]|uniref:tetratricopeptide repeat protein n=1 Tax=Pseudodesulfovibrio tunisiensis TaxID=463192 RepID=UPI001FB36727|nr:tetratricopeptide repeat protein [Pseudodesulfovibrio tunisiensis]